MQKTTLEQSSFAELGISKSILKKLNELGFDTPTPIQHQAIPIGITGQDIVGIAQTGTGKTLAFGIPILERLNTLNGAGLVVLPTRELASQVNQSLMTLGRDFGLRTAVIIGGAAIEPQRKALANKPHIIIATPGRLIDILKSKKNILQNIKVLVLDEADRMLDMGFEPQIKQILAAMPTQSRQTMLFSATMPERITKLAKNYMRSPLRVEITPPGTTVESIEQEVFIVPRAQKLSLLIQLLSEYNQKVLVFSRTKYGAKKIARTVNSKGYKTAEIHSNRTQGQRAAALKAFKTGSIKVLVATDVASRGIDVDNIELVLNFDLPENSEDYVHRIGRTGRAGKKGKAISFASPEQKRDLFAIEQLVKTRIPVKPLPEIKEHISVPKNTHRARFSRGRRPNSRRRGRNKNFRSPNHRSGYNRRGKRRSR